LIKQKFKTILTIVRTSFIIEPTLNYKKELRYAFA